MRVGALLAALLLAPGFALAQDAPERRPLDGPEPRPLDAAERRPLDDTEAPAFRGVGRLNVAGRRFCSATLIEPGLILTAAHCLFHPRTRAPVPVEELRFVAGLRRGETAAVRNVAAAVVHPDFAFEGFASFEGVRSDVALLALAEPIGDEEAPALPVAPFAPATPIAIVSYARDRAQAPSIEAPCGVISVFDDVAAVDCAVTYGASGAPLLQGDGAERRLVGVVSAMGRVESDSRDVTLSVLVAPEVERLRALLPVVE